MRDLDGGFWLFFCRGKISGYEDEKNVAGMGVLGRFLAMECL